VSFFSYEHAPNINVGFQEERRALNCEDAMLTLGGRPRFLGTVGVVGLSGTEEDAPAFLFLLPFGRPRPRLACVVVDVPR
jgi:hypothetical protein